MQSNENKVWCIVPAAGIGSRMKSNTPKQYLQLGLKTVLDSTLVRLLASKKIHKIVVCIHVDDTYWQQSEYVNDPHILIDEGGEKRSDSVLKGLSQIKQNTTENIWVLVHDAARPCVTTEDIDLLLNKVFQTQEGAILAKPIHDTIKKISEGLSVKTHDRSALWSALTPQVFKINELSEALERARLNGQQVTDEASAIELMAKPVHIVEGRADNIKITSPEDLKLARFYLEQQEKEACA